MSIFLTHMKKLQIFSTMSRAYLYFFLTLINPNVDVLHPSTYWELSFLFSIKGQPRVWYWCLVSLCHLELYV
jgi:hypothetical protein